MSTPQTIAAVNALPPDERLAFYATMIPPELIDRFGLRPPAFRDAAGNPLVKVETGLRAVELSLYHEYGFRDPVMYFHLADTLNYKVIVMIAVINDPASPRFDVDVMPDGQKTNFGVNRRNLVAEQAAMEFGLAPGQVRAGMRLMRRVEAAFEQFAQRIGDDMYYVEPLYYHNAINFERLGFAYQRGRKLMEDIHAGFAAGGHLRAQLDASTPFRRPEFADSIRGRSWAIHDGILGQPFTDVTMYKRIGHNAGLNSFPGGKW